MEDSQEFVAYQRLLARQLDLLEKLIENDKKDEALKFVRDLIEDTRATLD